MDPQPKGIGGTRFGTLREVQIDAGTITFVGRGLSPAVVMPDGRTSGTAPPRTVVNILLRPAKGSNIDIEIWLPDAENWNGRFLGLGNGGAAGQINSGTLLGPLSAGYAVATTDMGTAPDQDSGIGNPEVWKDFGFRPTHLMTVVAKLSRQNWMGCRNRRLQTDCRTARRCRASRRAI